MEEAIKGRTYDHSSIDPIALVYKHVCSEHTTVIQGVP
jgi:hypothetical protein